MNKCKLTGYVQNIQTQTGTRADGSQWLKYSFTLASMLGKTPNNINCYTWHSNLGKSLVNGQQIELTAYWPVNKEYLGKDGLQKSFLTLEVIEIENIQVATKQQAETSPFDTKQAIAQIESDDELVNTDDVFAELEKITSEPTKLYTYTFLAQDETDAIAFGQRIQIAGYDPQIKKEKVATKNVIQISVELKESVSQSFDAIYKIYKDKTIAQHKKQQAVSNDDGIKDAFGNVYSKSQVANTINQINQDVQSKLIKGDVEIDLGKHTFSVNPETGEVNAKKQ